MKAAALFAWQLLKRFPLLGLALVAPSLAKRLMVAHVAKKEEEARQAKVKTMSDFAKAYRTAPAKLKVRMLAAVDEDVKKLPPAS